MDIIHINDESFDKVISGAKVPVVVDFWATWCGPCKAFAPVLEKVNRNSNDKFIVCKVDVDENPVTSQKFMIQSIPTIVIFKDGTEVVRHVGMMNEKELCDVLAKI